MSTSVASQVVSQVSVEEKRVALIDQLCANRGAQYQDLKEYRNL
jgi:hypothetical protein